MQYSQEAVELIKKFEGFSSVPYICPAGKVTIGYGHSMLTKNPHARISEQQATKLLRRDLQSFAAYIKQKVNVQLNQRRYDALCSLVFNWGCANFRSSKGLKLLNKGLYSQAAIEFFSKERGVVNINGKFCDGLYRRRQAELALWNKHVDTVK